MNIKAELEKEKQSLEIQFKNAKNELAELQLEIQRKQQELAGLKQKLFEVGMKHDKLEAQLKTISKLEDKLIEK